MIKFLIGVDIILAALFAISFRNMPEQIPLLYSRPWGEAQIVDYWYIALLPILMHVFFFLNIVITKKFFPADEVPKRISSIANAFVIVTFSAIFIKILYLVSY